MPLKSTTRPRSEPPDTGPDFLEQILVVRDEEHRSFVALECHVQRVDRFQVEVIGWLVEDEHVRFLQHDPAEEQTCRLASRQRLGRLAAFLAAEEHLPEEPVDVLTRRVRIESMQPLGHRQPLLDFASMILRKIADRHFVPPVERSLIEVAERRWHAGGVSEERFEERCLADAVTPDQHDSVTAVHDRVEPGEY